MMTTLEYRYGGPPLVSEQTTFTEYLYVTGKLPPRHPVPAVRQSNCYCGWRESVNPCDCDCGLFKRSFPMPAPLELSLYGLYLMLAEYRRAYRI